MTLTTAQRRKGIPACWTWPLPDLAGVPDTEDDRYALMVCWQADRCATCGRKTQSLVKDHDHETGLLRGFLCQSCNVYEAFRGEQVIFDCYRLVNPASVCGLEYLYAEPQPRLTVAEIAAGHEAIRRAIDARPAGPLDTP